MLAYGMQFMHENGFMLKFSKCGFIEIMHLFKVYYDL